LAFECFLAIAQGRLIGLDLVRTPADFRGFPGGHAAMLVQVYWVAVHTYPPFPQFQDICEQAIVLKSSKPLFLSETFHRQPDLFSMGPDIKAGHG
jgi:hypothetical protein